jgi:hypothetical protein
VTSCCKHSCSAHIAVYCLIRGLHQHNASEKRQAIMTIP